jgi:hypothetical protein
MNWLGLLMAVTVIGCVETPETTDDVGDNGGDGSNDIELASVDSAAKADAVGWESAPTLHADTSLHEFASAGTRRVHSLWIAGSATSRVPLTISAQTGEDYDVRIAVLGPAVNGARPVLAADGYSSRKRTVSVSLDIATAGEHLVVMGSYRLATDTFYALSASCTGAGCTPSRVDALASPKDFALVGDSQRLVQMQLGDVLLGYGGDIEVETWVSPPMQHWNATKVASSYASGSQVNVIAPYPAVRWGDDLRLVVREPAGRILDTGVTTRFMPTLSNFVRLDAILYGDIASLQIAGVVGFFEGQADLRLRSETRHIELAATTVYADRPGMVGNGFNAFDATFMPDLSVAATDGELLSIGFINGNGELRRLGCFQYCNNLSGLSSCTGGPRPCPGL